MRRSIVTLALLLALLGARDATAKTLLGDVLTCAPAAGYERCTGPLVASWDGAPLSVDVYLPAAQDQDLPLVAILTGYPGHKPSAEGEFVMDSPASWARRGYAVLTLAPRGMTASCGPQQALELGEICRGAESHLADSRWWAAMQAGEPHSPAARAAMHDFATFHSATGIALDGRPAPTLLGNGLTDDLFPVHEALRHANRVKGIPGVKLAQVHGEFGGHGRTFHDPGHAAVLRARIAAFFDRHVRGDEAVEPPSGVEILVPSCADSSLEAVRARDWSALALRSSVLRSPLPQTMAGAGDPLLGRAVDPAVGVPRCTPQDARDQPGVATYRSAPLPVAGMFLLGSPEVSAAIEVVGAPAQHAQLAARLWDVDPVTGTQLLVSRTLYRPRSAPRESFQLHGTAYRFPAGHLAKLELLTHDAPYGRPSNLPFAVRVSGLELRLPTR